MHRRNISDILASKVWFSGVSVYCRVDLIKGFFLSSLWQKLQQHHVGEGYIHIWDDGAAGRGEGGAGLPWWVLPWLSPSPGGFVEQRGYGGVETPDGKRPPTSAASAAVHPSEDNKISKKQEGGTGD